MLTQGALRLAERVRIREISPIEVEIYIRRIEEVNPLLNAVVAERFDAARREARHAERALRRGEPLPPLHGVPFTVKEMVNLGGCRSPSARSAAGSIAPIATLSW